MVVYTEEKRYYCTVVQTQIAWLKHAENFSWEKNSCLPSHLYRTVYEFAVGPKLSRWFDPVSSDKDFDEELRVAAERGVRDLSCRGTTGSSFHGIKLESKHRKANKI